MGRQVSVPSGWVDESAYHTTAAISVPQPKPDCRKSAPFRASSLRPGFRQQRDARAPFAAHGEDGEKAQPAQHPEGLRERSQTGKYCLQEYGPQHHALAPNVVRENSARETAHAPAE
jgi:hypothetical protein